MDAATSSHPPADPEPPRRSTRHTGRWLLLGALLAVMLAVVLVDWSGLAVRYIERTTSAKTGRTVDIGDIRVRWQHPIRIEVSDISVSNPSWASSPVFFDAKLAAFEVRLRALLRRELILPYVELDRPRLFLEQQGDRRTWIMGNGEKGGEAIQPQIARAVLRDGQLNYLDPATKTNVNVAFETGMSGQTGQAGPTGPGGTEAGDRLLVKASGQFRGETLAAQATGGSILRLRDDDQPYPLTVDGRLGKTSVKADGRIVELVGLKAFNVDLDVSGPSMGAIGDAFDVAIPETPPYQVKGHLTRREGVWLVERMAGKVGDSDIAGQVQFEPTADNRPRPLLTASLVSQKLDFNDLGPLIGAPPDTTLGQTASAQQRREAERMRAKDQALPDKSFDTSKWRKLDAKVSFEAKKVLHAPALPAIQSMAAQFELTDGLLKLAPVKLGLAGGQATATLMLDGRAQPMAGALSTKFAGLRLDQMFPTVEKMRSSLGTLYGQVDLKSSGGSVKKLLGEADGSIHLAMAGGRISNMLVELAGLDGGEVIRYFVGGDREIRIRCGVVDLAVKDGVASTRTLLVDTTDSKVLGSGEIDLAREQLNLTFNVQPKDPSILSLRAPIHLTGSLRKPQVRPDTTTLATKGIAALALAAINPLLALLPTIETGPGEDANCKQLIAEAPSFTERGALRSGAGNESKLPPDAPKPPAGQTRPTDKSTTNGAMPSYPN